MVVDAPARQTVRPPAAATLAFIFLLSVVAYLAIWRAGFVWDDDSHLTENPCIVGPLGFAGIWTSAEAEYFPLVQTVWWVVHQLFGLAPLPYHLLTWGLHLATAYFLWRTLDLLGVRAGWIGAALWLLHPVQVESVAWISETTNTQSGLCFVLSVRAFVTWLKGTGGRGTYALAVAWAVAAMLSKPSTVMLPVVFLLCWWWLRIPWETRRAARVIPFFALSAVVSAWTVWEQKFHSGASGPEWALSLPERLLISARNVWFYLGKLAWPEPLSLIYPRWQPDAGRAIDYLPLAALAVLAIGLIRWRTRPLGRVVGFTLATFLVLLFPILGFFDVYFFRYAFVADHFQYLASMAPVALAGAGLSALGTWLEPHVPHGRRAASLLAGGILVAFTAVDWRSAQRFHDPASLWRATVQANPAAWMAHTNLGIVLAQSPGGAPEAIRHYEEALRLNPNHAEAHYNLGIALTRTRQPAEAAIAHYRTALRLRPDYVKAHYNLANELAANPATLAEAVTHYERTLELRPDFIEAHNNLAATLAEMPGRRAEALERYRLALRLNPRSPELHNNLAAELAKDNATSGEATAHFAEALRLRPAYFEAHLGLASVLARDPRRVSEAIVHFEAALTLRPRSVDALSRAATAYLQLGRKSEAIERLRRALELEPDFAEARELHRRLTAAPAP
ncbi:MAG: tetratricopeptide repeat protein [Opitutaceae bacterium]|nr:tetratricopeptide repeat protein [Opitutaceae bacterium]